MPLSEGLSGTNPSVMAAAFRGLPGTTEVTAQQVEDQIDQLNRLSQQLRALPQSPVPIEQMSKGQQFPLSQTSRGLPVTGFGRPLGVDPGYVKKIAANPLTGPNGLTKDVLSDLMFGNLKSLASAGGLSNFNSPMEGNELSPQMLENSQVSEFNNPLLEGKLRQSPLGGQGLGFPLPPNQNVDFNDLPNNDLENLKASSDLRSRHHTKSGRKKKNRKSDTVTKLLLTLLVDKLKDIYEMDKINSTQNRSFKMDSSTIGKIENTLKERSHPENNKNRSENADEKDVKSIPHFDSNLTFPVTISDKKGSQVSLIDSSKNGEKDDSSSLDIDTINIENIIKGIQHGNTAPKENSSAQIRGNGVDSGNSPQEISQKTTKTLNNDDSNLLGTGSSSEFHRVKMEPEGVLGKSETIPTISDYHPIIDTNTTDAPSGMFDAQTDKTTVSAFPTFSVSSILNQEIPGNVKGSNRVLNANALKDVKSESVGFTGSPTAKEPITASVIDDKHVLATNTGEGDTDNYLEASRVLGAVFNKVKDPLARKSVEVAIKAMLKLMKSGNAYSKKQTVPLVKKSWIIQEKAKRLLRTIHLLAKAVDEEAEETSFRKKRRHGHWPAKHKSFKKWFSYKQSGHHHKSHHTHHHKNKYSKH